MLRHLLLKTWMIRPSTPENKNKSFGLKFNKTSTVSHCLACFAVVLFRAAARRSCGPTRRPANQIWRRKYPQSEPFCSRAPLVSSAVKHIMMSQAAIKENWCLPSRGAAGCRREHQPSKNHLVYKTRSCKLSPFHGFVEDQREHHVLPLNPAAAALGRRNSASHCCAVFSFSSLRHVTGPDLSSLSAA